MKILDFVPVKQKIHPWKFLQSVRENFGLSVKSWKKVCVKATFLSVKNSKKGRKLASRALLIFTGKKKHWFAIGHEILVSITLTRMGNFWTVKLFIADACLDGDFESVESISNHIFFLHTLSYIEVLVYIYRTFKQKKLSYGFDCPEKLRNVPHEYQTPYT